MPIVDLLPAKRKNLLVKDHYSYDKKSIPKWNKGQQTTNVRQQIHKKGYRYNK